MKEQETRTEMRIAIPLVQGKLSPHFGHCEQFELVDAEVSSRSIVGRKTVTAPPHQPGLLPRWLSEQGATVIVAGGMGSRAQGLFQQNGIDVVVGAPSESAEVIAQRYLAGSLEAGTNVCDH